MLDKNDVLSTVQMIDRQHLDIRTITMGISLLSCADRDAKAACEKIYDKITRYAEGLVKTGEDIEREFGIPIVNKRISVTPIALVAAASETEDYVPFAVALDRAAKAVGVNFIGGFSALVQKGMTDADRRLIAAIPEALAVTDLVCSSVNVGSTKAGINMDAVALMGLSLIHISAIQARAGRRPFALHGAHSPARAVGGEQRQLQDDPGAHGVRHRRRAGHARRAVQLAARRLHVVRALTACLPIYPIGKTQTHKILSFQTILRQTDKNPLALYKNVCYTSPIFRKGESNDGSYQFC